MITHSSLDADLVNILRDYANELMGVCVISFSYILFQGFFDLSSPFFPACTEIYVMSFRYVVEGKDRIFLQRI